jgi:eukaryotic-like serine/threonine-protein kinase
MTQTGISLGTPQYMAPEQALGDRNVDQRADIYALGAVTYEMLAGEPPFTGPNAQAIVARVVTEEPRRLGSQRHSVPESVEVAVHTALSKLPADRFATATEFARSLTDGSAPAGISAGPSWRTRRETLDRSRAAVPWVLLAVLLAAGVWAWVWRPAPELTRQQIVLWQSAAPVGGLNLLFGISDDGRTMAFVDEREGRRRIFVKQHHELEAKPLTGTDDAMAPAFSPDGEWIAFVAGGRLSRIPRAGGIPITIADSANTLAPSVAWLSDEMLAFNTVSFHLDVVRRDGSERRRLVWSDSIRRGVVNVTAVPGKRGVVYAACTWGCAEADLYALDVKTARNRRLGDDVLKAWALPRGDLVMVRRDGGILTSRFDLRRLQVLSAPVPALETVQSVGAYVEMALSRSGTLVYIPGAPRRDEMVELVWVSRAGQVEPVDSSWTFNPTDNWGMALSPDGSKLALSIQSSGDQDVWIRHLTGGILSRLTFGGGSVRPRWTSDGHRVMYVFRDDSNHAQVRTRRADGTGRESTLVALERPVVDFEPAGNDRVVVRSSLPLRDIGLARIGDSTWTPLIAAESADEAAPALSPDRRWLAYVSNESGRSEIYVRPFPHVEDGQWQVSRAGGVEPLWAPNGREIFFRGLDGMLMTAAVAPGAPFSSTEPRSLFRASSYLIWENYRAYDVSPDGQRFLFARAPGSLEAHATPVARIDNWAATLGRAASR